MLVPLGGVFKINFWQLSDGFHLKWPDRVQDVHGRKLGTFHYYTFPAGDLLNHITWSIAVKFSQQTGLGKIFASEEKKWYPMVFYGVVYHPYDFWNF